MSEEIIKQVIINTIDGEQHLGENLKKQCLEYLGNLQQENQQLRKLLDKYENPEDMTLYTMWCTEKVKDENKQLQQRIDKAIEYIENHSLYEEEYDYDYEENSYLSGIYDEQAKRDLLEILKGDNDER